MAVFYIDGAKMETRTAAHHEIAKNLDFAEYYGANLDALWDMMSTFEGNVVLKNPGEMLESIGSYGNRILSVFYEAEEMNPGLRFHVVEEKGLTSASAGDTDTGTEGVGE